MSITLSRGSLPNVFSSRRVYQPLWQVVHVYQPDRPLQLLVSDGESTTNCVTLKPSCHVTYNKTEWKIKNSKKTQEEIILFYKFPILKIIDFEVAKNENHSIILLTKIKLMGWCKEGEMPEILMKKKIRLIIPRGNAFSVISKDRECPIEEWERPRFQFTDDGEDGLESLCVYSDYNSRKDIGDNSSKKVKAYTEDDLKFGDLAVLGPQYLDVLKICPKCRLLNYQTESRTASFTPPTKNFVKEIANLDVLKDKDKLHFCVCDDENEKFREEFQSKCIVVNQENSNPGKTSKVQCILIGKNSGYEMDADSKKKKKTLPNGKNYRSKDSEIDSDFVLPIHTPRSIKYSKKPTVCERCGVEDINMASCRQCQKVFYCSLSCKRADVKEHATVCRAFITVRRYSEDRAAWALQLREPEDGCGTCGFWRDSLKACNICSEVCFCCTRCEERGKEKHKAVCDAYKLIQDYSLHLSNLRSSELD